MTEKEFNQMLGRRLWARREELGISRDEFAKQLGYKNASSIVKIEHGVYAIDIAKLVKASEILGYDLDLLMMESETVGLLVVKSQSGGNMSIPLNQEEVDKVMDTLHLKEKQEERRLLNAELD
jgi:transcriptional regulator with XRE-family HTH domain